MDRNVNVIERAGSSELAVNKVLKNTYMLLGMTLIFSGFVAFLSTAMALPVPRGIFGMVILLAGFYGLLFAIEKTKNSPMGLVLTFVFTGFMGYLLGPLLNLAIQVDPTLIMTALGGTGLTFFGLSAYVLTTKKDMSFMRGAIVAGFWVLLIGIIANMFLQIPAFHLAIVSLVMLFSAIIIMYQTSAIIHGGETNYISATVTLFVSIYNIFSGLLQLLLAFGGDD